MTKEMFEYTELYTNILSLSGSVDQHLVEQEVGAICQIAPTQPHPMAVHALLVSANRL
jgi:hypothetical protein